MIVYHGTAANYLESFQKRGPLVAWVPHLDKKAFCTSKSREEAERFALRHTPSTDLSAVGIVLEFEAAKCNPKHYAEVRDSRTMWHEQEVAFYNTSRLKLLAYWQLQAHTWTRIEIFPAKSGSGSPAPKSRR